MGWGFLSNLFKKKSHASEEARQAALHGLIHGDSSRPLTQQQMMEQLGINIHMIEDDTVKQMLQSMSVELQENNGKLMATGNIDVNMLAMIVMTSKLIRTSFVDPIDSEIGMLDAERFVIRQEIDYDEETYELGGSNLNDALSQLIKTAWCDAKNGRKAKLLKVMAKTFEVRTPEAKKGEGGWV